MRYKSNKENLESVTINLSKTDIKKLRLYTGIVNRVNTDTIVKTFLSMIFKSDLYVDKRI